MDEEGDSRQFWLHSASTGDSTRPISSPNFFHSTLFMLIMAISTLLLLLFSFTSFPSSSSQIPEPNSVRKSWNSINMLLVLFAIVCGIFARWNEDVGNHTDKDLEIPVEEILNEIPLQHTSSPASSYELRWYEFSYAFQMRTTASGRGGLKRNSSSYPDLRQQSDWETIGGHEFKYFDDFEISRFNQSIEVQSKGTVSGRGITRVNGDQDEKVILIDTYPTEPDSAAKPLQNNPSSQLPHTRSTTQQKKTRVHRSVPKRERSGIENAPRAAPRQQPKKEDKGSSNPINIGLTSQTKPRLRKVHKDVPIKDETNPRPASESSSSPICPKSFPQVQPTIPMEEEHIKPTVEISSPLKPPELHKVTQTLQKQEIEIVTETKASDSPSPPPLPPTPNCQDQNQNAIKKDKKKSSAKKEIAMVWASIYKRKKKQNQPQQQQLGREDSGNYNGISLLFFEPEHEPGYTSSSHLFPPPSPAPPLPPPPPPHSVFHSLFKKSGGSKSKRIHSVVAPPQRPPPPPRQSFSPTDNNSQLRTSTIGKPPLPKLPNRYSKPDYVGYLTNSGSQSPLFDIPRPPPLPPFIIPDTKLLVRGDYAKIKSNAYSRNGSPEPYVFDDDDESVINKSVNDEAPRTTPYCPSPDVNAKADTFIARLRGEWRLEKMNSVNEKNTRMGI